MVTIPAPQLGDSIHLSASSITTMTECPWEFWKKYCCADKPQDVSASLVFGSALHESLSLFYNQLRQSRTEPSLSELTDLFAAVIDAPRDVPIHFTKGETPDSLKKSAQALLRVFLQRGARPDHVLAVEQRITVALHNPISGKLLPEALLGTLDLLIETAGKISIVDHKTCARLDPDRTRSPDLQMSLYSWAVKQLLGVQSVDLSYQFLVRTKEPSVIVAPISRFDEEREERAALMQAASASFWIETALRAEQPELALPKRKSWRCSGCGYRSMCASQD
ncbi:MAG: hypothetical protein CVU59_03850 [Deltaproteobacteria bacterium HGW-Deltaproteobacteria-17]|nr:MAG: hypothetical protein CVU59_03850 [Deltaproteobacteria bacterium HGW-Deltaproteobacteria-17]